MDTENDSFYDQSNVSSPNSSSGSNNSSSSNLLMNLPMLPILHVHGDDDDDVDGDGDDDGRTEDDQPDLPTLTAGIVNSDGIIVSANVSISNTVISNTNIVTNNINNTINAHNFFLSENHTSFTSSSSSTPMSTSQNQQQSQTQMQSSCNASQNSLIHPMIIESSSSIIQTRSETQYQNQTTNILTNETISTHLHQEHFSPVPPFHQQQELSLQLPEHDDLDNDDNFNEGAGESPRSPLSRSTAPTGTAVDGTIIADTIDVSPVEARPQLNPGEDFVGIEDVADNDDISLDRGVVNEYNGINEAFTLTIDQFQRQSHLVLGASTSAAAAVHAETTIPLLQFASKNDNYSAAVTACGFRAKPLQQQQNAYSLLKLQAPSLSKIFNFDRNGQPTNMYGQVDGPHSDDAGVGTSGGQNPIIDRLKILYPNVNEQETPLPRCWSAQDKCLSIGLSQNNLRVHYKGTGKQNNDAASVRTAYPIPPACGLYYFEVKIISKGKNGYMGIGLTAQTFRMNRLPGWDKQSYGYHGDDGNSFSSSGNGQSYGPTFTTGDVIGCCVNFVSNTCFYTKNGVDLGIAFRDLPSKLYPTVGLQTPGEEVDANFGQEPFKFDLIEDMMKQMREEMKATIYDFPIMPNLGDPTTLLHKMVSSYLVHNGYSQTAEAFAKSTGQTCSEEMSSIRSRQKIIKLAMSGKMGYAIEQTLRSYPGLLESNKNLWFMLKCRQFIEMINGSDIDQYCPNSTNSKSNSTTSTTQTQTTPAPRNQTSVIQSTKSYQNGRQSTTNSTAVINSGNHLPQHQQNQPDQKNSNFTSGNDSGDFNTNNANDGFPISNKGDMCGATSSRAEYQNDIEMENNGHVANGSSCKNGDASNFTSSLDMDEEMEVDTLPSTRKYSDVIERILNFGKELSQMGQQLEKDNKMTEEERQMLEDAFSLIAYSNPWSSPLGWQLCPTRREIVCTALNSAILESLNYSRRPPLDICVAHAAELLKVMAQASLGASAFVNIEDIFPQN